MTISDIDDLEENQTYHYVHGKGKSDTDKYEFTVDLTHKDDDEFDGYDEGAITFYYKDGYVADIPVSNVKDMIDEGKIIEGSL